MCIGRPARVIRSGRGEAVVDVGDGRGRRVGVAAPEPIRRGDYVLVYGNLAVNKIDRLSALETLGAMKSMALRAAEEDGDSVGEASRAFDLMLRRLSAPLPR